jgi:type I restriction enzyme S subunit
MSDGGNNGLPEGWAQTTLLKVTVPVANIRPQDEPVREFGYADISSISNEAFRIVDPKRINGADAPSRARRPVQPLDTLFSNVRTYLRNIAIVVETDQVDVCSTGFTVLRPSDAIDPRFLFRYTLTDEFIDRVTPEQTGTHYPATSDKVVLSQPIPLPPLAEQRRIVAKVEELLGRVQAARVRLARVPLLLKRFRQALLTAACNGQLTADWRETHPQPPVASALEESRKLVDAKKIRHLIRRGTTGLPEVEPPEFPEQWELQTVRDLVVDGAILDFQDGNHGSLYPRASDFGDKGVKFLTAQQVFDNRVLLNETPLLSFEKAKLLRIGFAKPRDVLLTHNATVGRVALLPEYDGELILGTSVTYYRTNPSVLIPEYIVFQMQGQYWQDQLKSVMEQTTRNQVSVTKQVEFRLMVPPFAEQQEIVRRVDALFKLADAIEQPVAAATARADRLTQAILAKAFRGELVPTEADLARTEGRDYEPADELLARIQSERPSSESATKPHRRRRAKRS